jgi:uncharacterized protein (DUF305 family)
MTPHAGSVQRLKRASRFECIFVLNNYPKGASMNIFKKITLVALCLGLSNVALAQSSGQSMESHGDMAGMSGMQHNASKAAFDHQFLDSMTMHHEHGIKMAELVQSHSSNDELKALANEMINDQRQEMKQMQEMKQQWYADKGDAMNMQMPGMKESMQGMDTKMQKLQAAQGAAFDKMFVQMMTQHHKNAIRMAQQAQSNAQHQEVKQMAKKMRNEQQKEISEMTAMAKGSSSSGQ